MNGQLVYYYGVMGAAKSLELIRSEYNYREKGFHTKVFIPAVDTRNQGNVNSRLGVQLKAITIEKENNLFVLIQNLRKQESVEIVFIDEVHFLEEKQIDELAETVDKLYIDVFCYGLKTDYKTKLFPASRRLLELADSIQEIETICKCGRKAILTAKYSNGLPVKENKNQIMVGEKGFQAFCRRCYKNLFDNN